MTYQALAVMDQPQTTTSTSSIEDDPEILAAQKQYEGRLEGYEINARELEILEDEIGIRGIA